MRLNWILDYNMNMCECPSMSDVLASCKAFYEKYHAVPDTIKFTYNDYAGFIGLLHNNSVQTLEKNKKYGLFLLVPGGMVELLLLDQHDEAISNNLKGQSVMVLESSELDRAFEKHVLNVKGKNKR